jgi:hypothetical protein
MKFLKSITAILAGILIFSLNVPAQPVRDRILDDVHIIDKNGCPTIQVSFTFPVRYVRHFPFGKGDELQIQIEPINIGPLEQEVLFDRESYTPPHHKHVPLDDVIYEGDIEGGPYLTLLFTKEVSYEVGQGPDFRSILVSIQNPSRTPDGTSCPHLPKIQDRD